MNCHLDLISSKVLNGVGHSGVAIEARYHELLRKQAGCDLRKRISPQDGGYWTTARLQRVFVDPLPNHLHKIIDVMCLRGLRRLALIGVFLTTWGRGSAMPLTAFVWAVSVACGYEG